MNEDRDKVKPDELKELTIDEINSIVLKGDAENKERDSVLNYEDMQLINGQD